MADIMFLVQHSGGLELLCDSKKFHSVAVEPQNGSDEVVFDIKFGWIELSFVMSSNLTIF